jgi:uncharacterized membrane protein
MSPPVPVDRRSAAWRLVAAAAGLVVALQLWGLYAPQPPADAAWFPGTDKVAHAVGFGLPVALVMLADTLRQRTNGRRPRARVLILATWVSAVHAVVSELVQAAFYTDRRGDPLDLLADWSGIAIAAMLTGLGVGLRRVRNVWRNGPPGAGIRGHV